LFLSSGGYALVFIAYDVKTNKEYALKVKEILFFLYSAFFSQRLFAADDNAKKAIAQEISFLVCCC